MKKLLLTIVALGVGLTAFAQGPELKLPEDKELADMAKRKFAISVDEMSIKRYGEAAKALNWLVKNTPDLYDGLYINGYKAYEELAEATNNEAKKDLYLDSMFFFFNKKAEVFELSDLEKNNKAYRYYKYWKSNRDKIGEGMEAYKVAYENPSEVINNNIVSYMDMARRYKAYGNPLSDQEALDIYGKVLEVIDMKIAAGEDEEKQERYRGVVNGILTQIIGEGFDCEFIEQNLAPPLDRGEDVKLAKKVLSLLLDKGCTESPYFEKAAEIIQAKEPNAGFAKILGQRAASRKDYSKASAFYMEALSMTEENDKKADLHLDIAKLNQLKGDKAAARAEALKAVELSKELSKEAYELLGDLYFGSFEQCAKQVSQIDDRAVFMIAHDMYTKAGASSKMANAKAQFPTISDVFTANKKEGDPIKVGCWINANTTIKVRPSN
ncbi:hypothetical protein [Roseivirga pacifica]|uniref:hypothetical protein n=1 Tax=Roseivirga pacifica TaxID=1267423 RepID=UPI00227B79B4|nr:hypothetical protein [Roseivirga pacifica]